jgi:hypothetical protein
MRVEQEGEKGEGRLEHWLDTLAAEEKGVGVGGG